MLGRSSPRSRASEGARRERPPLDAQRLNDMAVRYVARYATTEAKLATYLRRKLKERGWGGEGEAPVAAIVERCVEANYVDDRAFAELRSGALGRRGYGHRRVRQALAAAGIDREIVEELTPDEATAEAAADRYAQRRRFGPYSAGPVDPIVARRHFAAMLRAGHDARLAARFTRAPPDDDAAC